MRARIPLAAADFQLRRDSTTGTARALAERLKSFAPTAPRPGNEDRCRLRRELALTRVGFDPSLQVAFVTYYLTVGPGPYPGCGYVQTGAYFLRRTASGEWDLVAALPGIIT
ncbi:MAG TPA: hypothetical protein VJR92_09255 [Gemmatimonadaceae bacterium]|nr:hypothetical protein [Gemmatimonadaceae bacterium]